MASSALINYLQEECEARFADLSFLKKWYKVRTQPDLFGFRHRIPDGLIIPEVFSGDTEKPWFFVWMFSP